MQILLVLPACLLTYFRVVGEVILGTLGGRGSEREGERGWVRGGGGSVCRCRRERGREGPREWSFEEKVWRKERVGWELLPTYSSCPAKTHYEHRLEIWLNGSYRLPISLPGNRKTQNGLRTVLENLKDWEHDAHNRYPDRSFTQLLYF